MSLSNFFLSLLNLLISHFWKEKEKGFILHAINQSKFYHKSAKNSYSTFLYFLQVKYRGRLQYMKKQTDINSSMRSILIDWLVEVAEEYKLQPQTLFLTVNYIDRFLSQMSVLRGKLQLVGAACMLVAT